MNVSVDDVFVGPLIWSYVVEVGFDYKFCSAWRVDEDY